MKKLRKSSIAITVLFLVTMPLTSSGAGGNPSPIFGNHILVIEGLKAIYDELDPPETPEQKAYRKKYHGLGEVTPMPCRKYGTCKSEQVFPEGYRRNLSQGDYDDNERMFRGNVINNLQIHPKSQLYNGNMRNQHQTHHRSEQLRRMFD